MAEASSTSHRVISTDLAPAYWNARPMLMTPSPETSLPRPVWHAVSATTSAFILRDRISDILRKPSVPGGHMVKARNGSIRPGILVDITP